MAADIIIVAVYMAIIACFGLVRTRGVGSLREFAVPQKGCSAFALTATMAATYIGGGFSTGNAASTAQYGVGNMAALTGFSLSMVLVGQVVVPRMQRFKGAASVGEVMLLAYGKKAQVLTGLTGMLACAGMLGAQMSAIGQVFSVFLGMPAWAGVLCGCAVVLLYSTLGGMGAVVAADVAQFIVLSACMPLLLLLSARAAGGMGTVIAQTPAQNFCILNGRTLPGFISAFLAFALGEALAPPCAQRLLMGRSMASTRRAVTAAGLISVPFFLITGLVGMAGAVYFEGVAVEPNTIMQHMIRAAVPTGLRGLMIAGMLAVVTSSADSLLNSAAVGLVADVVAPLCRRQLSPACSLRLVRIANLGIGGGAILVALAIPGVLDALTFSYSFWSPVALVPLAAALLGVGARPRAAYAGAAAGAATALAAMLLGTGGVEPSVLGCAANFAVFCLLKGKAKKWRWGRFGKASPV